MSIYNLDLTTFQQEFNTSKADRLEYGEIYTPFSLINKMLDLFDPTTFLDATKRWLDIGAGQGYFSLLVFERLNKGLVSAIPTEMERKKHIIEKMLYMVELKDSNVLALKALFGTGANIIHTDFCLAFAFEGSLAFEGFDIILGNPPYNAHGMKKAPTNHLSQKKQDGQTIWTHFIQKSLTLLKPVTGQLCVIIPSLWLKPDKAQMHEQLTQYKIEKMHCLSGNETNAIFKGAAQTPTCFFLLTKTIISTIERIISLYDYRRQQYVNFKHQLGQPIPIFGAHIIQKIQPYIKLAGGESIKVYKTNMPPINSKFSDANVVAYPYINITTCLLNNCQPILSLNYSNIPQAFHGVKKLVLAHKMHGFPYFDRQGTYGIANRDNYVILDKTDAEFAQLQAFLSTKFTLYIFEAARYRMKYLEKYAFQFLPDITRLPGFPLAEHINEDSVATFFGLDEIDKQYISGLHRKEYKRFI